MPIERVYDGKGMDAKTLAAIEPFCISYHGVSRANVKEGDKVLVVGAGTIGVLAAIAAKAKGATVTSPMYPQVSSRWQRTLVLTEPY